MTTGQMNLILSQVLDLPAAESVYHQACSVNFRTRHAVLTLEPGMQC